MPSQNELVKELLDLHRSGKVSGGAYEAALASVLLNGQHKGGPGEPGPVGVVMAIDPRKIKSGKDRCHWCGRSLAGVRLQCRKCGQYVCQSCKARKQESVCAVCSGEKPRVSEGAWHLLEPLEERGKTPIEYRAFPCSKCEGTGLGPCGYCRNASGVSTGFDLSRRESCKYCKGTGRRGCEYCMGSGRNHAPIWFLHECGHCGGKGKRDCRHCNGRGVSLSLGESKIGTCFDCRGARTETCPTCAGRGQVVVTVKAHK